MELLEFILSDLSVKSNHPLLTDVLQMNSFVTDVWCDTCHNGPETNDFYLRNIFDNGTGGFGLSLTHKSPKCSLQDCLNTCLGSKCDESNDRFKVTDSGYFHDCKNLMQSVKLISVTFLREKKSYSYFSLQTNVNAI